MTDQFTHTTSKNWFSRMGSAFSGIIIGLLLIVAACALLFWNEGRAVKRDKTLKEGVGLVLSVPAERGSASNEGKLVHVSGRAVVGAEVRDDLLNVSAKAVRLKRSVEMLQWVEESKSDTRKKLGGGTETVTTYSYNLKWTDRQVDSSRFRHPEGHTNNVSFPVASKTFENRDVRVGAFSLNASQISRMGRLEDYPLGWDNRPSGITGDGSFSIVNGVFYIGSRSHDRAGDVRIKMQIAKPGDVSVVARQTGKTFSPYKTSVGGTISLLSNSILPAQDMFQNAVDANTTLTWILRVVGIVMMFIGFRMMLNVLSVAGDLIPILGNVIGAGLTFVSFLVAIFVSFIIIAIAWILYRPLIALALIAIGAAAGFVAMRKGRKAVGAPIRQG